MTKNTSTYQILIHHIRRHWIWMAAAGLLVLVMVVGEPAWAATPLAPPQQTVPDPTSVPEEGPPPEATPRPDRSDDNDDDNNDDEQFMPTPTPESATQDQAQPAVAPVAPPQGLSGVVTVAALNVREGPGTGFRIAGSVYLNEQLAIISRNELGDWWLVCCVSGTTNQGWVNAQLIEPNFDRLQANTLIPLEGIIPVAPPTPVAASQTVTGTESGATVPVSLTLQVELSPPWVWQGQTLDLQFLITNPADGSAVNVNLSDELPADLQFVSAEAGENGQLTREAGDDGRVLLIFTWPALGGGEQATAVVKVQVADDLPNGAVIDNLIVVGADDIEDRTIRVGVGMPPTLLPDYR